MGNKKLNFKFLEDIPVSEDSFGTHNIIAKKILSLIQLTKGGKAIALIGSWGSGKSSVVEMLKNEIKDDKNLSVFVFDSWEHEGGALRKGFLESLIKFLIQRNWLRTKEQNGETVIENEDLDKKYKILKGKINIIETHFKPKFSWWKRFFVLFLYLVPLGLIFLSQGFSKNLKLLIGIGIIILLLPLFEISILEICKRCKKVSEEESLISMFFEKKIDKDILETRYETPDPSSLEFEDLYKSILKESLKNDKKLIVVIDNLDRIDPSTALKLFSTIKPFIQLKEKEEEIFKKVWYIVPFDEDSLKRLWIKDEDSEKYNSKAHLADSFLEKIFQFRFNVPPVILSDWKEYFTKKLKEASNNVFDEYDIYIVRSIFENIYFTANENSYSLITPRVIKLFINNFLNSYILREDIHIGIHSLFVSLRDFQNKYSLHEIVEKIKNDNLEFFRTLEPFLPVDWKIQFLALFFNVEKDKVAQIIYERDIENAILRPNREFFESHVNKPGFKEAVESVINKNVMEWINFKPYIWGYLALLFKDDERLLFLIYSHAKKINTLTGLNNDSGLGFSVLLKKYNEDEDFKIKILSFISDIESNFKKEKEEE